MDATAYINLLKNPAKLSKQDGNELKVLSSKYPFMSGTHLLLAKKYHDQHPSDYEEYLHKAAIYASDRKRLYHFIKTDLYETVQVLEPAEPPKTVATEKPVAKIKEEKRIEVAVKKKGEKATEKAETKTTTPKKSVAKIKKEKKTEATPKKEEGKPKEAVEAKKEKVVVQPKPKVKPKTVVKKQSKREGAEVTSVPKADEIVKHTFAEWLRLMRLEDTVPPGDELSQQVEAVSYEAQIIKATQKLDELQDEETELQASDEDKRRVEELAHKSAELDDDVVTETLAKIYAAQGMKEKAIKAYENLSLKFPEKKAFFAQQIKDLNK